MTRNLSLALLLTFVLTACNGGGTVPGPSGGTGAVPTRAGKIYASDICVGSLASMPASATGVVVPTTNVVGAATSLSAPYYLALDPGGNVWVSDLGSVQISRWAATATGNAAPSRSFTSASFIGPTGIAIDASGTFYVADVFANSVMTFASSSSGTVAPSTTIGGAATTLNGPEQVVVDGAGDIWVANFNTNAILEFAPGSNGNVAPIRTIAGAATGINAPDGLALDPSSNIWVANQTGNSVLEFAAAATGNVAPIKTLSGAATGIVTPISLAIDQLGYVYVAMVANETGSDGRILVFPPTATGNVAPAQAINATAAGLQCPSGIAVR